MAKMARENGIGNDNRKWRNGEALISMAA